MSESPQSFESHAKIVPGYHRWATALLVLPTLYFGYLAVSGFTVERAVFFLFCIGVILAALYWTILQDLATQWWEDDQYTHG